MKVITLLLFLVIAQVSIPPVRGDFCRTGVDKTGYTKEMNALNSNSGGNFGLSNPYLSNDGLAAVLCGPYAHYCLVCERSDISTPFDGNSCDTVSGGSMGPVGQYSFGVGISGGILSSNKLVLTLSSLKSQSSEGAIIRGERPTIDTPFSDPSAVTWMMLTASDELANAGLGQMKHAQASDGNTIAACSAAQGAQAGRCYIWDRQDSNSPFTESVLNGEAAGDQLGASGKKTCVSYCMALMFASHMFVLFVVLIACAPLPFPSP